MVRLLLIHDCPDDRRFIINHLQPKFSALQTRQIVNEDGFQQALTTGEFDLVITDCRLAWVNGLAIVQTVKSHYPDCPVIMFTGCGSEEAAVAAFKAGVDDYVIKSAENAADLSRAVDAVLDQVRSSAEIRQTETSLRNSEQRLRDVLDCSPAIIFIKDLQGRFTLVNRQFEILTQLPRAQVIGKTDYDLFADELAEVFQANDRRILESGNSYEYEELVPKQGELRTFLSIKFPLYDEACEIYGVCGISTDITDRKRLEIALQQQADRDRLLTLIAQRIRRSLNLGDILQSTVAEVRQFLLVDRVILYQVLPDRSGQVVAESVTDPSLSVFGLTTPPSSTVDPFFASYQQGQVFAVEDMDAAKVKSSLLGPIVALKIKAKLVVPILVGEQLWGILSAHNCAGPRPWQMLEIELLKQLATQVAIAIQQSELYQQVQQLNNTLEQQVQERTAELQQALEFEAVLKRITDIVRDSLDERQIMQKAVRELAQALNVRSCNTAIYDLDTQTATIQYDYSIAIASVEGRVLQMTKFPEVYDLLLKGQHFQYCPLMADPTQPEVSKLATPVFDSEGVLGDLWLTRPGKSLFNSQEIRLVQQVANQCAIAIRQARLFQVAQVQVQELKRLNQLKDDFLSTVSHELRTPVSNMKLAIQMLKVTQADPRGQQYLNILQAECDREVALINDLLDLQHLEEAAGAIALTDTLDLQTWLPDLVQPFRSRLQDQQQVLEMDIAADVPPLTTNASSLERVLAELINNACKYTPNQGELHIRVHQQAMLNSPSDRAIVFTIRNQAEIASSELGHIFEKFYRVPNADPWKRGGTGLGLALVQKLVERLAGNLSVESSNGWTSFTVQLKCLEEI